MVMRIRKVEVYNFRALRNSSLNFSSTTALLGENNSGKSAFLLAIDLFFSSSPKVDKKDFSDENVSEPIDITIHFGDFTPYDHEEFQSNLLDDELVITRRFSLQDVAENGRYFVSARVNPDFSKCRAEEGKAKKRDLYAELRKQLGEPVELPKEKNADEIEGFLLAWEEKNKGALKVQKVAAFKGWTNVAAGKLKQKTSYVLIRAVQDAATDIQQSKSSQVRNLIDTIAKQTIENDKKFKNIMEVANKEISEITDPKNVPILADISKGLTTILDDYYKNSEIIATWQPIQSLQPSFPSAYIEVKNNDFVAGLDGVGHGLQRAVILTVLRYMADHRALEESAGKKFSEPQSDLILAIEEPEIYQHPTKQRLFRKLLHRLAEGFNAETGIRVQTIFVTHSPLFVSVSDCEGVRIVRGVNEGGMKNVNVSEISLDSCAKRCADVAGKGPEEAWSGAMFGAKLHTFGTELAEGFFGRCTVLVEGVGDQAVLQAWYEVNGRDPHAEGIVIGEVGGKNNLDRPIVIFEELRIPCYWIFDNDESDNKKGKTQSAASNRRLQLLGGVSKDGCVDWPVGRFSRFTSWDSNLEKYVRDKVGDVAFQNAAAECAAHFAIDVDTCLKFPASAERMLLQLRGGGASFAELDEIIAAVDDLVDS